MNYFLKKHKLVAWVILLTFLLTSVMPSNFVAGNSVASAATAEEEEATEAVVTPNLTPAAVTYNSTGQVVTNSGALQDGQVRVQKTAAATGNANEYNVTLNIEAKGVTVTRPGADIVLVLDRSASMSSDMDQMKNAAKEFVNTVLPEASNNRVAVVSYGTEASKNSDFIEYTAKDTESFQKLFKSTLSGGTINASGNTNTQHGIYLAEQMLANSDAAKKIIVLLSDGVPTVNMTTKVHWEQPELALNGPQTTVTWSNRGNGNGWSTNATLDMYNNGWIEFLYEKGWEKYTETYYQVHSTKADGDAATSNQRYLNIYPKDPAIYEAGKAKNNGTEIYTIGYKTSDYLKNQEEAKAVLDQVATDAAHAYEAATTNISTVFGAIGSAINTPISDSAVNDPMGANIVFDEEAFRTNVAATAASFANSKLTWNPDLSGTGVQSATITYTVKIDVESDANYSADKIYPLNGTTSFSYKLGDTTNTVYFTVPTANAQAGTVQIAGYRVNNAGQPIDASGTVVATPQQAQIVVAAANVVNAKGHNQFDPATKVTLAAPTTPANYAVYAENGITAFKQANGSDVTDADATTDGVQVVAGNQNTVYYYPFVNLYTVTYTDGVDDQEVFADQVTANCAYGSATPSFTIKDENGNDVAGTPTRTGYRFIGWSPEVATTVTANATYTAQWIAEVTPGDLVIRGVKVWDDTDDTKRPPSIKVKLMQGNTKIDEVTVSDDGDGDNRWPFQFVIGASSKLDLTANMQFVEDDVLNYELDATKTVNPSITLPTAENAWTPIEKNSDFTNTFDGKVVVAWLKGQTGYLVWTDNATSEIERQAIVESANIYGKQNYRNKLHYGENNTPDNVVFCNGAGTFGGVTVVPATADTQGSVTFDEKSTWKQFMYGNYNATTLQSGSLTNTYTPKKVTGVTLRKTDGTSPLAGASFTLNGNPLSAPVSQPINGIPQNPVDGTVSVTEPAPTATFAVGDLEYGETYTIAETNAPTGYKKLANSFKVKVDINATGEAVLAFDGTAPQGVSIDRNVITVVNTPETYTVTYKVDGVQVGEVEEYSYGTSVTVRPQYEKPDYTVTEWTTNDATIENGGFTMPAKNVVIEATTGLDTAAYQIIYHYLDADDSETDLTTASAIRFAPKGKEFKLGAADKVPAYDGYTYVSDDTPTTIDGTEAEPTIINVYFKVAAVEKYRVVFYYVDKDTKATTVIQDSGYVYGIDDAVVYPAVISDEYFDGTWYTSVALNEKWEGTKVGDGTIDENRTLNLYTSAKVRPAFGNITVKKIVDSTNQKDKDADYKFTLQIKTTVPNVRTPEDAATVNRLHSAVVTAQTEAAAIAKAVDEAQAQANGFAEDLVNNVYVVTTESAYSYLAYYTFSSTDETWATWAVTSSTSYGFELGSSMFKLDTGVVATPSAMTFLLEAIEDTEAGLSYEGFFTTMMGSLQSTGSALAFDADAAYGYYVALQTVADKQDELEEANAAVTEAEEAEKAFLADEQNRLIAGYVKVFDSKNNEITFENGSYTFYLKHDQSESFTFQTTSGAAISFVVTEEDNNGATTTITADGSECVINNATRTVSGDMTTGSAYVLNYKNAFKEEDPIDPIDPVDPWVDPGDNPYVPPTEETIIDEPEVPQAEPVVEPDEDVEIEEPEVPLGDAPQTGDNANAAGMMALLVLAAAGLAITRRRFN